MNDIKRLLLDADDTLWENNVFFLKARNRFFEVMQRAGLEYDKIEDEFYTLERRVVAEHGYGSSFFILILEKIMAKYNTAVSGKDRSAYDDLLKDFKQHRIDPPLLFPGVLETLKILADKMPVFVLTKGQKEEQEEKIIRAGVAEIVNDYFIVPEKDVEVYRSLVEKNGWDERSTCMVGNSPKSDINPALQLGMHAVYIPYKSTWHMEDESLPQAHKRLKCIDKFSQLTELFGG